jgi:hypothetical protein
MSDDPSRGGKELASDWDAWNKTFYHRAIRAKIGNELRAQYELPQGLPQRLVGLLMQLDT